MKSTTCDICRKNHGVTFDIPPGINNNPVSSSLDICLHCQLSLSVYYITNNKYLFEKTTEYPQNIIIDYIFLMRDHPEKVKHFWSVVNYMIRVFDNG